MVELLILCPVTDVMRQRIDGTFEAVNIQDIADKQAWLSANGAQIKYVLTGGHLGVPEDIWAKLPNLQMISCFGVGYDGIDTAKATALGIPVTHTPDVLNEEVATTALLLYLACWRNFEQEMAHARTGRWESDGNLPLPRRADGRTVGILGLGRIGKAIARKLEAFDVKVIYHGRSEQNVPYDFYGDLTDMARACETLICVAPGDASTHHLINRDVMDAIGPDGFLINVGRGSTVDETALISALQDGRLGGAGLDVFEDEPRIPAALRSLSNVILTPHIASATQETRRDMGDLTIDNLIASKKGQPLLTPVPESQGLL